MSFYLRGLFALAFLVLCISPACASVCGDDLDGVRVACDCGSTVVSDIKLRIDDPIVMHRCELNGLFIRAGANTDSIRVDLGGFPIVGSGAGTGIRVFDGGRAGATIVGGSDGAVGQILGFSVGISARGRNALATLRNVLVESNTKTGIIVNSDSAVFTNVATIRNGADGARIGGRDIDTRGLEAISNAGLGIVTSDRARTKSARSESPAASNSVFGEMNSAEVPQ
jgi:hypothetical protein